MSVAVVVPTLSIQAFLKESIESILAQDDVGLEIVVVDGGSRDETVRIATSYGDRLRVISEPGLRQAAAINRGVRETRSPFVLVLSGDDLLMPGALAALVRALADNPEAEVAYGEAYFIDDSGARLGTYPVESYDAKKFATVGCFIPHAAAIVRREAFVAVGGLDETLDYALDFDFWIRLSKRAAFAKVHATVAAIRMHAKAKTLGNRRSAYREAFVVFKRYFGYVPYTWVYAYANYLIDGRDQFFDPLRKTKRSLLLSLVLGYYINFPKFSRYTIDWFAARKIGVALRER